MAGALASSTAIACGSDGENNSNSASGGSSFDQPSSDGNGGSDNGGETGGSTSEGGSGAVPTCGDYTATNIEGPFFLDGSPERADIRQDHAGPSLRLTGRVLGPDCTPLEGALVDFWQADEAGDYDADGSTFRGHQTTDAEGRYALETIVPGRYLNGDEFRPAHIHVKVSAGGETLTTQLYFPDDPYNDVDAFIVDSLIMAVEEDGDTLLGSFDFIVRTA